MEHIVTKGDSPWTLAVKYVNNGNRWPELCKANPQLPKHPQYGCVFTLNKPVKLPDAWVPAMPVAPGPGGGPGPSGPVMPIAPGPGPGPVQPGLEPSAALAPQSSPINTKVILIGAAVIAVVVVGVYAMKRKKAA